MPAAHHPLAGAFAGSPKLLEVNCNPSLAVDAVYVTEGPYAQSPPGAPHLARVFSAPHLPPNSLSRATAPATPGVLPGPTEALVAAAVPLMKGKGVKVCKCR